MTSKACSSMRAGRFERRGGRVHAEVVVGAEHARKCPAEADFVVHVEDANLGCTHVVDHRQPWPTN
jgi:hypothetical protein